MTIASEPAAAGPGDTPTRYGRAGDRVTVALRELIANGTLHPGEHLRQDQLAAQLGSTRVPVREAFKTLVAEGMLVHRPNYGHFVAKLTSNELAEICWLRDTCENRLASTVVWTDAETIGHLRLLNESMRALIGHEAHEVVEADRKFHEGFWALSPMRILAQEAGRMWGMLQPYRSFMEYSEHVVTRMYDEHEQIVAALEAEDLDTYTTAVAAHQRHIYDIIKSLAERESRELAASADG